MKSSCDLSAISRTAPLGVNTEKLKPPALSESPTCRNSGTALPSGTSHSPVMPGRRECAARLHAARARRPVDPLPDRRRFHQITPSARRRRTCARRKIAREHRIGVLAERRRRRADGARRARKFRWRADDALGASGRVATVATISRAAIWGSVNISCRSRTAPQGTPAAFNAVNHSHRVAAF